MATETPEDRMARWWADWWAADYSWEGLGKESAEEPGTPDKPWRGWWIGADGRVTNQEEGALRPANRQDYWRRGPGSGREEDLRSDNDLDDDLRASGELIEGPGGQLWHLAHAPAVWRDGAAAKSAWAGPDRARLDALLTARLDAATPSDDGIDRTAQFRGAVLFGAARPSKFDTTPIHADFGRANFLERAHFGVAKDRNLPAFSGDASFDNAAFSGDAWFDNAAFSGDASFDNAAFSGDAGFENAAFSGNAGFENAAFSGNAGFYNAAFSGNAGFYNAAFSGNARFYNAAFSGNARFESAAFSGNAGFYNAAFSGNARFESAAFSGDARFENAAFLGAASFTGQVQDLTAGAKTQGLRLEAPGPDGVRIGALTTEGGPSDKARRSFNRFRAEGALFAADVDFSNRDFLAPARFKGARFLGLSNFHGGALHPDVSFQDADFDRALQSGADLSDVPDDRWAEWHKRLSRAWPPEDKRRDLATWRRAREAEWAETRAWRFANPDRRHEDLERAFRTLKQAMEGHRHRVEEARFFRLELLARRHRRDVPLWERLASDLYGVVSDYGSDLIRPQLWLGALVAVVALIALLAAEPACGALAGVPISKDEKSPAAQVQAACPRTPDGRLDYVGLGLHALAFSGSNTLPLAGAFAASEDPRDHAVATILKANASPFWRLVLRGLSTIQSLISVTLLFLTGLALRRRFQIN